MNTLENPKPTMLPDLLFNVHIFCAWDIKIYSLYDYVPESNLTETSYNYNFCYYIR